MGDPVEATSSHPGFAWPWGIYRWTFGEAVTLAGLADPLHDAAVLASFLRALQAILPTGGTAPGPHDSGRGLPLAGRRDHRACTGEMHGMINADAVTASWEASLEVPAWSGPPRWVHGDIHQGFDGAWWIPTTPPHYPIIYMLVPRGAATPYAKESA